MRTNLDKSNMEKLPFAGCSKLLQQYKTIGSELLVFDKISVVYFSAFSELREGLAFVSLEVLESYFDDLLDPEISDESLFIAQKSWYKRPIFFLGLGFLCAVIIGLTAAVHLSSFGFSLLLTISIAFPFAVLAQVIPGARNVRRMRFAKIISKEINRRRGSSDDKFSGTKLFIEKVVQSSGFKPATGMSPSVACLIKKDELIN
jgi:hypothetical protein